MNKVLADITKIHWRCAHLNVKLHAVYLNREDVASLGLALPSEFLNGQCEIMIRKGIIPFPLRVFGMDVRSARRE